MGLSLDPPSAAGRLPGSILLPDGTPIRGRGRRELLPDGPQPDFALHLGKPGRSGRTGLPPWPHEVVDWPDFRVPRDREQAEAAIVAAYQLAREGRRVEVTCGGGNGRTGTVIACLAVLTGHPATDAVGWARRAYRSHAVETWWQRRWVHQFASRVGPAG